MTATLAPEWSEPMQTGGGGALIEVLLGVIALGAAGVSALGVLTAPPEPADDDDSDEAT